MFVAFILMVAFWIIGTYNTLVNAVQDWKRSWSDIKTEYQRRADLFVNLVTTVKSFKKHEKETLTLVAQARSLKSFKGNGASEMKTMQKLDKGFANIMATFEAYPILKADKSHESLMEEIRITEDRINMARTHYNEVIEMYNSFLKAFPNNLIANMFGFIEGIYYESDVGNKSPVISLD